MTNTLSRFIRTTWLLSSTKQLELPTHNVFVRRISSTEAAELAEQTRKRNVFARHRMKLVLPELRDHGESYEWECQCVQGRELGIQSSRNWRLLLSMTKLAFRVRIRVQRTIPASKFGTLV